MQKNKLERDAMPSDFGRGLRFGMGFAVGVSIMVGFFLFGVSMCAGHFQKRIFDELKEQLEESIPPGQRPQGEKEERVSFPSAVPATHEVSRFDE